MDGRPTWTDCYEAGDYVVPNVLSPRDLVCRPANMDETVPHTTIFSLFDALNVFNSNTKVQLSVTQTRRYRLSKFGQNE